MQPASFAMPPCAPPPFLVSGGWNKQGKCGEGCVFGAAGGVVLLITHEVMLDLSPSNAAAAPWRKLDREGGCEQLTARYGKQ
jgi:hypothetical protein